MQRTKKPCMSWSTEYFSCIQTVLLPWDRPSVCCCVSDRGRYEDHTSAAYFQIVSSATVKTQTYRIYHSRQIHRRRICTCSGVGSVHKFRSGVIYCSTLSLILICWLCKKTHGLAVFHCITAGTEDFTQSSSIFGHLLCMRVWSFLGGLFLCLFFLTARSIVDQTRW